LGLPETLIGLIPAPPGNNRLGHQISWIDDKLSRKDITLSVIADI